jgi:PAS domain S-box-containing protein
MDTPSPPDFPFESSALSETLLEVTDTLVVLADAQAEVRYMNPAARSLMGYTVEELRGSSVFETMIPEEGREQARHRWNQVWDGAGDERHDCQWVTKTGELRHIALSSAVVQCEDERYFLAMGTDCTQLRQLEEEVVSVSESERRRIGQELHDGLASELIAATISIENLRHHLGQGRSVSDELLRRLKNIEETVRKGAQQARSLSHLLVGTSIRPEAVTRALSDLTDKQEQVADTACRFHRPDQEVPMVSSSTVAGHLYRIAQEAVRNAVAHADASHVDVYLDVSSATDSHGETPEGQDGAPGKIVLCMQDDGTGVPDDVCGVLTETDAADSQTCTATDSSGFGIGVHLMQYRADLIGARLTIESTKGKGTTVTCELPLEARGE